MCGLVGIAGDLAYKDEATLKRLLFFDYFRGTDSTGLAAVRNTGEFHLAKVASHPLDLFDMQRFKTALNGNLSKVLIGHNRATTRGATNATNAHPFEFGHIVGAHNGTLDYRSTQELEERLGEKFEVDSQAIFAHIAKFGIEETIPLLMGAWALVWYDLEQDTLNFIRNKERPFWYCYSKDFDRIIWASETHIIRSAIAHSAFGYELYENDKKQSYFSTMEDVLYSYKLSELRAGEKKPKPFAKELKGKERPAANTVETFPTRTQGGTPLLGTTSTTDSPPLSGTGFHTPRGKNSRKQSGPSRTMTLVSLTDPLADVISKERWNTAAKSQSKEPSCWFCQEPVSYGEPGTVVYTRDDIVLCGCCTNKDKGVPHIVVPSIEAVVPELEIVQNQ